MELYIVRHGEPNYELDCLTELGKQQAELLADKLENIHFDKVYCSTHGRAYETCTASARRWGVEPIQCDWAREDLGAKYLGLVDEEKGRWTWSFWHSRYKVLFRDPEVVALGRYWYKHPYFKDTKFQEGIELMQKDTDAFFLELGYKHDRDKGEYIKVGPTPERVIIFAHGGFGVSFFSSLMDIPYNVSSIRFQHLELTSYIRIKFDGDVAVPIVIEYNNFEHLKN